MLIAPLVPKAASRPPSVGCAGAAASRARLVMTSVWARLLRYRIYSKYREPGLDPGTGSPTSRLGTGGQVPLDGLALGMGRGEDASVDGGGLAEQRAAAGGSLGGRQGGADPGQRARRPPGGRGAPP